jgi:hypothetical protein
MSATNDFMTAFSVGLMNTVKDWPAWIGLGVLDYVGEMIQDGLIGQNTAFRALGRGLVDTSKMDYFYAVKEPTKAKAQSNM